ncbi:MAG TPA: hypothetical protein VH114_13720 [Candidatus Acidoferrum sp.]|jgi:hypothetical protein|nr:hypothetical protein [Candidatus Acidoferrum sp.]
MQTGTKMTLIQGGKWTLLGAGALGSFFAFAAWFLVPGTVDLNRIVVAGLFASLAINAFLLSGVLSCGTAEDGLHTLMLILRTPPVIASVILILAFVLVTATIPIWARR